MNRVLDPQYWFHFSAGDGRRYSKSCFWETRYVFTYGSSRLLAAARVVPFSNVHESLYLAFQGHKGKALTGQLLPEADWRENIQGRDDFVEDVAALVPDTPSRVPQHILDKAETELEAAASQELVRNGIQGGLNSFDETDPFSPAEDLSLPQDSEADAALIRLSFQVDAALKVKIRDSLPQDLPDKGLIRHQNIEFDIARRLYSNPRYLGFVKRLLQARGSYMSPVVQNFLSFYARCLNVRLEELGRKHHISPDVLARRVEGVLGREHGDSYHFLDYYDLTLLGAVVEGDLDPDPVDPDYTGENHFKLSGSIDSETLLLREIEDKVQRFLIRQFARHIFNSHHNVKSVQFIDETERPRAKAGSPAPDEVERRLQGLLDRIETWLGAHSAALLKTAVAWLMLVVLAGSGLVVWALYRVANP